MNKFGFIESPDYPDLSVRAQDPNIYIKGQHEVVICLPNLSFEKVRTPLSLDTTSLQDVFEKQMNSMALYLEDLCREYLPGPYLKAVGGSIL